MAGDRNQERIALTVMSQHDLIASVVNRGCVLSPAVNGALSYSELKRGMECARLWGEDAWGLGSIRLLADALSACE